LRVTLRSFPLNHNAESFLASPLRQGLFNPQLEFSGPQILKIPVRVILDADLVSLKGYRNQRKYQEKIKNQIRQPYPIHTVCVPSVHPSFFTAISHPSVCEKIMFVGVRWIGWGGGYRIQQERGATKILNVTHAPTPRLPSFSLFPYTHDPTHLRNVLQASLRTHVPTHPRTHVHKPLPSFLGTHLLSASELVYRCDILPYALMIFPAGPSRRDKRNDSCSIILTLPDILAPLSDLFSTDGKTTHSIPALIIYSDASFKGTPVPPVPFTYAHSRRVYEKTLSQHPQLSIHGISTVLIT
ncbi:hypothetical protein WG66_009811, partial [Moniliophthora roreri]